MKTFPLLSSLLMLVSSFLLTACGGGGNGGGTIPIVKTAQFSDNLSAYQIYADNPNDLEPAADYHLYTLDSSLFVNYAEKQRLIKIPAGKKMTMTDSGLPIFPDGTILVKTFYYFKDKRDPTLGKRLIETRLLVKQGDIWNAATYIWNDAQTDAIVSFGGDDISVIWTNESGRKRNIAYHIPNQVECVKCHQNNGDVAPIAPSLRNLNIDISVGNAIVNQLQYFQNLGLINTFDIAGIGTIANYKDPSLSATERGRAYLDMNCAHCHNPSGWSKPADKGYDFRYETPITQTKILKKKNKIVSEIATGDMPYLGTTVIDAEGLAIIREFVNQL